MGRSYGTAFAYGWSRHRQPAALHLLTSVLSGIKKMARSLVVKHEEKVGTSSLLNAFLLIALAWMVGGAVMASTGESSGPAPLVGGQ